jgi:hypothetical protein
MQQVNNHKKMTVNSQSIDIHSNYVENASSYQTEVKPFIMSYEKASTLYGGIALIVAYISLFLIGLSS